MYYTSIIATFDMKIPVDGMFFINNQLVAISNTGKVVVWQSVQKHWQVRCTLPWQQIMLACSNINFGDF